MAKQKAKKAASKTGRGTAAARARKIKLIIFDVDGVLTDGTIWLFPAPAGARQSTATETAAVADAGGYAISSATMIEAKGFHAHDGTAFSLTRLAGIKTGIITKRISETVALRARDLRVDYVFQGQADKTIALEKMLAAEKITDAEVAYVGDDIVDLPVMRRIGLAIAVKNAREAVMRVAHHVTPSDGGKGAGRDAVEFILRAQKRLVEVEEIYLQTRPAVQAKS